MNPQEFSWTEDQQVTVTNPTSEAFTFKVHNKEYQVGAGKTARMPGYMAWLYVYNQAVKKAQADKVFSRWNEEELRKEYYEKFIVGADPVMQTVQEAPQSGAQVLDDAEDDLGAGGSETEQPQKAATRGRTAKA